MDYSKLIKSVSGTTDMGRMFDFKRIAIHIKVLPPHSRSNQPHCESHEEEFFHVLKGQPHVWIQGEMIQLKEKDSVGFPSGTGINHAVINNTEEDVVLFMVGERTKPENKFNNVINPELCDDPKMWWHEMPILPLSPHDGQPQKLSKTPLVLSEKKYDFIKSFDELKEPQSFSYPVDPDKETFSNYRGLARSTTLKVLGVSRETLNPGKRSSWPHAHFYEEEFAYILAGNPSVWLNGYLFDLNPGDAVAFPANSGVSHTLMNNSDSTCEFMVVGEQEEKDKIIYPLHPARNEECKKLGYLWEDFPELPMGSHDGQPTNWVKN